MSRFPHDWIKSTLGHGDAMCKRCHITNNEAAVLGMLFSCDRPPPLEPGEIIQLKPGHKWGLCLATVDLIKSFGCMAFIATPMGEGTAHVGLVFLRLEEKDYVRLGTTVEFTTTIAPLNGEDTT